MDGSYIYDNFGDDLSNFYIIKDPDELAYISFAPEDERRINQNRNFFKKSALRVIYHCNLMDPLKQKLFLVPIHFSDKFDKQPAQWLRFETKKVLSSLGRPPSKFELLWVHYMSEGIWRFNVRLFTWLNRKIFGSSANKNS